MIWRTGHLYDGLDFLALARVSNRNCTRKKCFWVAQRFQRCDKLAKREAAVVAQFEFLNLTRRHPEEPAFLPAGRGISRGTQRRSGRSFASPEERLRSG